MAAGTVAGRRRRLFSRRLVAAAVAVVVLAGGGTYLGLRLTSVVGPPTSGLRVMWTQDSAECPLASSGPVVLPWIADGLAVFCAGNGVLTADQLSTGRVAWTWRSPVINQPNPGTLASLSQTSETTDDGIGVVGYENGDGVPDALVGIDIATGRQLWRLSGTQSGDLPPPGIWEGLGRVAAVMVSGSSYALQVYDLATGALDWSSTSRQIPPAGCDVSGDAISGPWVYAVTSCLHGADQLYQMSLQTGSVIAQAQLQDAPCKAVSSSPTLWAIGGYVLSGCDAAGLGAGNGGPARPDVVIIRAGGVLQRALRWTGSSDDLSQLGIEPGQTAFEGMAASGGTLYVGLDTGSQTTGDHDVHQEVEKVAAIDLSTASLSWFKAISVSGGESASTIYPVLVIGANRAGALDVLYQVSSGFSPDPDTTGITLAAVSAAGGTVSYGPGTTVQQTPDGRRPLVLLDGDVLLIFGACPTAGCPDNGNGVTVAAYSVGSWHG